MNTAAVANGSPEIEPMKRPRKREGSEGMNRPLVGAHAAQRGDGLWVTQKGGTLTLTSAYPDGAPK